MESESKQNASGQQGVALPRIVRRRCGNCVHAGKGFKVAGNTNHHCSHPARVAGIKDPCGWDTIVEWHFRCDNWAPKPNVEVSDRRAHAVSLVMHLPPETLAGDVQRWRDEAKLLLANVPSVPPERSAPDA